MVSTPYPTNLLSWVRLPPGALNGPSVVRMLCVTAVVTQSVFLCYFPLGLLTKMHVQSCVKCGATRGEPDGKRTEEELTGSWGGFEFHLKPRVNSFLWPVSHFVPLVETFVA